MLGLIAAAPAAGCLGTGDKRAGPPMLPSDDSAEACRKVGDTMAATGHYREAILEYEKARQHDPAVEDVGPKLAALYDRVGQDGAAKAEYERAVEANPKSPDALNDLGRFHYQRGRWAESEKYFRSAVAADPQYARGWVNLGLALGQQRRPDDALAAFERAVSKAEAKSNLAFVYATQRNKAEAERLYREALALDPGLKQARRGLALLNPSSGSGGSVRRVSSAG